jgi:hypothetical protein
MTCRLYVVVSFKAPHKHWGFLCPKARGQSVFLIDAQISTVCVEAIFQAGWVPTVNQKGAPSRQATCSWIGLSWRVGCEIRVRGDFRALRFLLFAGRVSSALPSVHQKLPPLLCLLRVYHNGMVSRVPQEERK